MLRKVSDFWGPCLQKIMVLDFWMGFDIWLRLGKHVMKRGWEEGVPAFSGMKRWDPGSDRPRDDGKVELC